MQPPATEDIPTLPLRSQRWPLKLFLLAIWVILRGAAGVLALKSGRAIRHPTGWWI